ncbi:hypothetical protein GGR55DRAFT_687682 [Xylaria sp. FL0064]|nr:hypothetical protein GGR55DRAFT_687682 [Xylaria sp. FL0064]
MNDTSPPNKATPPVRLMPVPGRVSRAKKGVPVHTCEICRPPKTFTRAEHLRRHQLSHRPAPYSCPFPGCDKLFHRTDLLDRHMQGHRRGQTAILILLKLFLRPHTQARYSNCQNRYRAIRMNGDTVNYRSPTKMIFTDKTAIESFDIATDSGYASLGLGQSKIQLRDTIRSTLQESSFPITNVCNDDNRTEYSGAFSLHQARLEIYVSEFAEELAAVLPRSICAEQLPSLSAILPDLLKISKAVVDMFADEGQETDEEAQKPHNSMSIQDKMLLWARKEDQPTEDPVNPVAQADSTNNSHTQVQCDDGIDNENEVFEEFPEIQEYRHTLLNSPAYSWLLKSVINEVELEIPAGIDDMRRKIRNKILEILDEPSTISHRNPPPSQHIVFKLPWIRSYLVSQKYTMPVHQALPHAIVVVGVEDQSLVTTCGKYLGTLWPDIGPQILGLCMSLLSSPHGFVATCTLFDKADISAKIDHDGSTVEFYVTGTVYSLAEIGEIVVWMSAAFNNNSLGHDLVYRRPICGIEKYFPRQQSSNLKFPIIDHHLKKESSYLNFTFAESTQKSAEVHPRGRCWVNVFGDRPVVSGYPIPRRAVKGSGAEIPLGVMAQLINAKRVSNFDGSVLIKAFSAILVPTQRSHDIIFWHLIFDQLGGYVSYTDPRVKDLLKKNPKGLTRGSLETSRHILGWTSHVLNHAGPGFAFEKISIVGGMFLTAGVSTIIGKKDKAVHFKYRDDYTMQLKWVSKKFVVLYDVQDRRAWLLDGASALLHLVRASLRHDLNDPFKSVFLFQESALGEPIDPYSGKDTAISMLTSPRNIQIPLYAKPDLNRVEVTTHHGGREARVLSSTKTNYCLKDKIEDICNTLEQILAHQADTCTQDGVGFKVKASDRRHIEGFDFMDVATDEDPCWPKQVTLRSSGRGWVDFVRSIHAITLFGTSFGDLFSPSKVRARDCISCHANMDLPKGQDLLAVCVAELSDILQKRGSKATTPWRLVDDIYWLTPDKTFEPCQSGQKCDRVQVLLPATFPKLWGRNFKSPGDLSQAPRGALIFGHSRRFPLRWGDRGDPEQGDADHDHELEVLQVSMQDSGVGTSLESSSGNGVNSPPSAGSSSLLHERTGTPMRVPEGRTETRRRRPLPTLTKTRHLRPAWASPPPRFHAPGHFRSYGLVR